MEINPAFPCRDILSSEDLSELAFWPRYSPIQDPFIVSCGEAELSCHYHEYDPDSCTVVFFHGNGEVVSDYSNVLPRMMEVVECNTFIAEYRGYGGSTGSPSLNSLLRDCEKILESLPSTPERTIFFGRSLGCLAAVQCASLNPNAKGMILESGISDLYEYLIWLISNQVRRRGRVRYSFAPDSLEEIRNQVTTRCPIREIISRFNGGCAIAYSLLDAEFRQKASEDLYSWLTGAKRLVKCDLASHNELFVQNAKVYCEIIRSMSIGRFESDL